jgi:hypothetical protein
MLYLLPLLILTVWGLLGNLGLNRRPWLCLMGFAAAVPIEVSIRGTFYHHYYQFWLPVLCIGAAWTIEWICLKRSVREALVLTVLVLTFLLGKEAVDLNLPVDEATNISGGIRFAPYVAAKIDEELLPEENYYEWTGNLYFSVEAHKDLAAGVPHGMLLYMPPLGPMLSERTLEQLKKSKPELLVFDHSFRMPGIGRELFIVNPVYAYLTNHYTPYGQLLDDRFLFCYRKGGSLEKRIKEKKAAGKPAVFSGTAPDSPARPERF